MVCSPGNELKSKITSLPLNIRFKFPFLNIAFVLIESGKKASTVEVSRNEDMQNQALIMEC